MKYTETQYWDTILRHNTETQYWDTILRHNKQTYLITKKTSNKSNLSPHIYYSI
ncbi:hypothetical protein [Candidatus Mycoplasma haematohominis]|uniref:hypothetical protein n=1 Tax=Candidatus Mycoplasma haematohominis TaxID=1494318 RepID=UPI001C0A6931|nr:hypothetical protein [Candidatus Mycoplasma haemohominis]